MGLEAVDELRLRAGERPPVFDVRDVFGVDDGEEDEDDLVDDDALEEDVVFEEGGVDSEAVGEGLVFIVLVTVR